MISSLKEYNRVSFFRDNVLCTGIVTTVEPLHIYDKYRMELYDDLSIEDIVLVGEPIEYENKWVIREKNLLVKYIVGKKAYYRIKSISDSEELLLMHESLKYCMLEEFWYKGKAIAPLTAEVLIAENEGEEHYATKNKEFMTYINTNFGTRLSDREEPLHELALDDETMTALIAVASEWGLTGEEAVRDVLSGEEESYYYDNRLSKCIKGWKQYFDSL